MTLEITSLLAWPTVCPGWTITLVVILVTTYKQHGDHLNNRSMAAKQIQLEYDGVEI